MKRFAALLLAMVLCLASAGAEEIWTPREAPAIRNSLSAEEKAAQQQAILEKGEFLFSGVVNQRYRAFNIKFLKEADPQDLLALLYATDKASSGTLTVESGGKSMEINASGNTPGEETLRIILASVPALWM